MNRTRLRLFTLLALLALAVTSYPYAPPAAHAATAHAPVAQGSSRTFPQTGKTVRGRFLDYWTSHGGLAQQGYPISNVLQERSETDGKTYFVQYFERAVFEFHEEKPYPDDVLLSLLGVFLYNQKYPGGAPGQKPDTSKGSVLFKQTGHRLGGKFLAYWNAHGGLPQQGYPISDPFTEISPLDGKTYTVQYFERAVFELHPENKAPYDVLLSQLGTFRLQQKYPSGLTFKDADGDGVADTGDKADKCPDQPENLNKIYDTDGCPDTLDEFLDNVANDINGFWQETFDNAGDKYVPPVDIVAYDRPIRTACGNAELENAFYCSASHTIYYDINFLADQLYTDGDFAPATILAHEWGHLIQADTGILHGDFYSVQIELQADCLAGAWAKHANEANELEEGDLDEAATSLFQAGDDIDTPWFDPQAHGQPDERIDAFSTGLTQGVGGCSIDQFGLDAAKLLKLKGR